MYKVLTVLATVAAERRSDGTTTVGYRSDRTGAARRCRKLLRRFLAITERAPTYSRSRHDVLRLLVRGY